MRFSNWRFAWAWTIGAVLTSLVLACPTPTPKTCTPACPPGKHCVGTVCVADAPVCPAVCPTGEACTDPTKGCQKVVDPKNEFPNLLLKADNGYTLQYADGTRFEFLEFIPCCLKVAGTGWPMSNKATIDEAHRLGRSNVFHYRIGPFGATNEPEYATLGGPYVQVGNKVDLDHWNEPFFAALADTIRYSNATYNAVGEVVPVDDWVLKTVYYLKSTERPKFVLGDQWGPVFIAPNTYIGGRGVATNILQPEMRPKSPDAPGYYPWHPLGNIQGEDAQSQAPGPRQEALLRKVVDTVGMLGVFYQVGQEEGNNTGYNYATVTAARARIIRDEETKMGFPHRLLSQNSEKDESFDAPDTQWTVLHLYWPTEPFGTKWRVTSINEYNPGTPAKAVEVFAKFCRAQKYGSYVAAWRHEMPDNEWTMLLGLMSENKCTPELETGCGYPPTPLGRIDCGKLTTNIWDCTPKETNGQPFLPEGATGRNNCEAVACGTCVGADCDFCKPSFYLINGTGTLSVAPRTSNPTQIRVSGSGTGQIGCTTPATGDANVCRGSISQ